MNILDDTPIWQQYMPNFVNLYYVDYRDSLDGHEKVLQECITKNSFLPLSETVYDWWDYPEGMYLDEIRRKMTNDDLEDVYEKCEEEIKEWLWDNDKSTPIEDLLNNTNYINAYYSLGVNIEGFHEAFLSTPWCNESEAMKLYKLRRAFGIKKATAEEEKLHDILSESWYGGDIRIYFQIQDLKDFISGNKYDDSSDKQDFKSIKFKGRFTIAVWNSMEGSGNFEELDIDINVPFVRDNLFISNMDKYGLENSCGMPKNWLSDTDSPVCSLTKGKCKKKLARSENADNIKREAELTRVFEKGGCTAGDMDINRHRDVYYRNEIPCGHKCPHCGTFWID